MVNALIDIEEAQRNRERIEEARKKELPAYGRKTRWDNPPKDFRKEAVMTQVPGSQKKQHGGSNHAKHQYIEAHKEEIIADFLVLGRKKMLEKWTLSSGGWNTIQKKWAADIEAAKKDGPAAKEPNVPVDWQAKYFKLQDHFNGYRQAVLDICGKQEVKEE